MLRRAWHSLPLPMSLQLRCYVFNGEFLLINWRSFCATRHRITMLQSLHSNVLHLISNQRINCRSTSFITSFNPLGLPSNWLLLPILFNLLYKLCNSIDSSDDSHSIRACYFDKEGSRPCCEVIFQFQPAIGVLFNTMYNSTPCANNPGLQSLVS